MARLAKRKDYLAMVTGFMLLLAMLPFYVWHISELPKLLILIIPIVPLIIRNDIAHNGTEFIAFFVILLLNILINGFSLLYSIYTLFFVFAPFGKREFSNQVFDFFRKILAVCFVISLFQWFIYWVGIDMPSYYVDPLTAAKQYNYVAYPPLLVVPNNFLDHLRFLACFDEPGVVGTICLLILFVEKYNFKDYFNIIIFIAGLFSFSMFFIGGTVGYFLIKYGLKNPVYIMLFLLVLGVVYMMTKDNETLYDMVYSRFEWDASKGSFSGDTRASDIIDSYYNSIKGTSSYYFGVNEDQLSSLIAQTGTYSYKIAVMRYGMVFFASYVLFFLWFAYMKKVSFVSFCIFAFALIATLYQRPNMYDVVYMFLFAQIVSSRAGNSRKEIVSGSVRSIQYGIQ